MNKDKIPMIMKDRENLQECAMKKPNPKIYQGET